MTENSTIADEAATKIPVRVVIADDHQLVRAGLRAMLHADAACRVVAEASDGVQLLEVLRSVEVDVLICDINMPRLDGMKCIEQVHREWPELRMLALSMDESAAAVRAAIARGALGYLAKRSAPHELLLAVRAVAAGERYLSPVLARELLATDGPDAVLTARQIEVLSHVAQGRSSREIGQLLGLSAKTVDVHRARIMERLEIRDVAGLTRFALRHRLIA